MRRGEFLRRSRVPSEDTPNIVPNFSAARAYRAFALMMK